MTITQTLLVHPDEDDVDELVAALECDGCEVDVVSSATGALAELARNDYDCVVSEYDLPGDDGVALVDAVQALDDNISVVLFTEDDSLASDAFDAGADRFVRRNGSESVTELRQELIEISTLSLGQKQDVSGHEPESDDIVRAVDHAPLGVSLSDPSLSDNPIVYVNEAWQEVTGYDEEEILGRNPRILQGPETDSDTVETLATAIQNEVPITVEIRNYRSDGTPWWNELTVAPIRNDDGEVVNYVGFQNDVTDRKRTENLAEERAEKLTEEKAALNRVLERVSGLVNEIAQALVEEENKRIVAQRVCDEITAEEGYAASWFATLDSTEDNLEIEAKAGLEGPPEHRAPLEAVPEAITTALETEKIATDEVGSCSSDYLCPAALGARRLSVVPLMYGGKRYGLLGVYGEGSDALDYREQTLFEAIGKMIASRLNAIETAWILTTDSVVELCIEIRDPSFSLMAASQSLGVPLRYVGMTGGRDGKAFELFVTAQGQVDCSAIAELPDIKSTRIVSETDSTCTFAMTVETGEPFTDLADYGVSVVDVDVSPERAQLVLEAPPNHDVRSIVELLERLYENVELRSRREYDRREQTQSEFASDVDRRLTERQRGALEAAYMNGYFEWPRPTDGGQVADSMGITRQTFHQHLRAAKSKLVEAYMSSHDEVGTPAELQTK